MGIIDYIQVTLIALKVLGLIQWEWWKVLIPVWIVLIVELMGGE